MCKDYCLWQERGWYKQVSGCFRICSWMWQTEMASRKRLNEQPLTETCIFKKILQNLAAYLDLQWSSLFQSFDLFFGKAICNQRFQSKSYCQQHAHFCSLHQDQLPSVLLFSGKRTCHNWRRRKITPVWKCKGITLYSRTRRTLSFIPLPMTDFMSCGLPCSVSKTI